MNAFASMKQLRMFLVLSALAALAGCPLSSSGSTYTGQTISVPTGTFQRDIVPANTSTVSAFRMSETEITRAQFTAVTGLADPSDPGYSTGTDDPVQASWYQALVFCNLLSISEGLIPVYTINSSTDRVVRP